MKMAENLISGPKEGGRGFLSIWVNVWFDTNNQLIGVFDQSYSEGFSTDNTVPLKESLGHWSLKPEILLSIEKQLKDLGVSNREYIWILMNHQCHLKPGLINMSANGVNEVNDSGECKPFFLGNFPYL